MSARKNKSLWDIITQIHSLYRLYKSEGCEWDGGDESIAL